MRTRLIIAAAIVLVGWSLGVVVLRWVQVRGDDRADGLLRLRITSFGGGADVPQPSDEWPSARAAWAVYQEFRRRHPQVALDERETLRLSGAAGESAMLMSIAGRTAGEIIAVNYRVLESWVDEQFLFPLDEYVIGLARENLSDAAFVAALPPEDRPAETIHWSAMTVERLRPAWVEMDAGVWETVCRRGRDGRVHVWAWPNELRTLALYHNRYLFAQRAVQLRAAGLDPTRGPRTWEEMIEYCRALADPQTGNYGLLLDLWGVDPYQRHSVAHLTDLLWQAGARIVEQDASGAWHFAWDRSDGTIDALRFLRELLTDEVVDGGRRAPLARYRTAGRWNEDETFGTLSKAPAMTFDFSSSYLAVKVLGNPEMLGISPLPAGPVQFRDVPPETLLQSARQNPTKLVAAGLLEAVPAVNAADAAWRDLLPHRWPEMADWAAALGREDVASDMAAVALKFAHPRQAGWLLLPGGREAPLSGLVNFGDGWRIRAAQIDASMFGITSLTTDRARRDAAWEYIRFLNTADARRIRTDLNVEGGMPAFLNPQWLREFGYDDLFESIPAAWRRSYDQIRHSGRPSPSGANCQYVHQVLARMLDSLLILTPQQRQRQLASDHSIRTAWRAAASPPIADACGLAAEDAAELRDAIRESRDYADRRLLNRIPPAEQRRTERWALVVVATVAVVFPTALLLVIRNRPAAARAAVAAGRAEVDRRPAHLKAWAFMGLAFASVLLWQYYPLARGALMAFQDYRIVESADGHSTWVGLRNFAQLFTEPTARRAALNTLLFVVLSLGIGFVPPIALAIMLDEIPRGTMTFRILYYLPAAMGGLIVAYLWTWLFSPQTSGWLNRVVAPLVPAFNAIGTWGDANRPALAIVAVVLPLAAAVLYRWRRLPAAAVGLVAAAEMILLLSVAASLVVPVSTPVRWLSSSPLLAMVCVIIPGVWAGLGPGCIIYLAALRAIPEEVYEAADLDGAGSWYKIRHVTLPFLKPLIVIQFVGAVIAAFRNWEGIFVMTGGGPKDGTLVVGMEVWYNAFAYLRFGYATALAWVLGAGLIGFTVLQLRVLRNARFTTAARS